MVSSIDVDTASGPARVTLRESDSPVGLLVLGPGASGSIDAPDLRRVAVAGHDRGFTVALVDPPYHVAGRKVPPPGLAADKAFVEVVRQLRATHPGGPLVTGGRSFGSRVACRTAVELGAAGVLCLAFPLHPPGKPEKSRLADLEAAADVPVLIVQGRSDPFGQPDPAPGRDVVLVDGDHGLKKDQDRIVDAVLAFLEELA